MAREGSKRQISIDIMNANKDKPMQEVLPLIAAAVDRPIATARSIYKFLVEHDMAPGEFVHTRARGPRQDAVTAEPKPAAKAAKAKAELKSTTAQPKTATVTAKAEAVKPEKAKAAPKRGPKAKAELKNEESPTGDDSRDVESKDVDAIKAANLARMKEVSSKRKQYANVARPEQADPNPPKSMKKEKAKIKAFIEGDDNALDIGKEGWEAPAWMSKDEVRELVG